MPWSLNRATGVIVFCKRIASDHPFGLITYFEEKFSRYSYNCIYLISIIPHCSIDQLAYFFTDFSSVYEYFMNFSRDIGFPTNKLKPYLFTILYHKVQFCLCVWLVLTPPRLLGVHA